MPIPKRIGGFFLRLIVIDALLLVLWMAVGEWYSGAFRLAGNILFSSLGSNATVVFQPAATPGSMDIELSLRLRRSQAQGQQPISSRHLGYVPTALAAALVLATPIPWPRRRRALLWALALTQVYIALRVLLALLAAFSGPTALASFSLGEFGNGALAFLADLFSVSLIGCYIGPLIIWIAVTFRRGDWDRAFGDLAM